MAENTEHKDEKAKAPDAKAVHAEVHHKTAMIALIAIAGVVLLLIFAGGTIAVMRNMRARAFVENGNRVEVMGGRGFGRGGMMRGRGFSNDGLEANLVSGKVTSVNDKKFTVSVNGTDKTVQISDTTRFPNTSATKVAVGDTVVVVGQQDSNGVIQATNISVNPAN